MNKSLLRLVVFIIIFSLFTPFFSELAEAGRRGGSPPPPPPPPCPTKSAGCYDKSDNKAEFGTLTSDTFGYYLSESAYIPGGCSPTVSKSVDQAKITNPDAASGACGCIAGADFDNFAEAGKQCCGDDTTDCALESRKALCVIDSSGREGRWASPDSSKLDILFVGCKNQEYLFDGSLWDPCAAFSVKAYRISPKQNHDYLCSGEQGEGSLAECCGSETCYSKSNGRRFSTGGSISLGDNQTYYCASDEKFSRDLDTKDKDSCERAKNPDGTEGRFKFTGTKCCSEDDDVNEYYNDQTGGCWNGKPILSVDFTDDNEDVVNYNGHFEGCALSGSFNAQNDAYLNLVDSHTGEQLIHDNPYCTQDPQKSVFCSFSEKWKPTNGADKGHLRSAPIADVAQPSECCSESQCWNGQNCVSDQSNSPLSSNSFGNFRCLNGTWVEADSKTSIGGTLTGYCPQVSQCLVNPNGNPADNGNPSKNPQCIFSGQYSKDNLCENGNWTTRTKSLSLSLLESKQSGDFVLSCDISQSALNELNYLTPSGKAASAYFGANANNVCVLSQNGKTLLGASFNNPFTDSAAFDLFGVTSCSSAQANDGEYHKCDSSGVLWYNKKMESIIFSKTPLSSLGAKSQTTFTSFLSNPLLSAIQFMKSKISSQPSFTIDRGYENMNPKFSRLYIAEDGGKKIFGTLQGEGSEQAIITYQGFTTDICSLAKDFAKNAGDTASGIECTKEGTTYTLLVQGGSLTKFLPSSVWADLTSKLRIG